jgi:hypothetical protein
VEDRARCVDDDDAALEAGEADAVLQPVRVTSRLSVSGMIGLVVSSAPAQPSDFI